jgi:myosin heavy subunit
MKANSINEDFVSADQNQNLRGDLSDVENLTELQILDENTILNTVCERYESNNIYTYCGEILIAVNPWRQLHLYSKEYSREYFCKPLKEKSPHCFAIADVAYRDMISNHQNQSILVSGDSGAGKTETAKYLLQHLVYCSSQEYLANMPDSPPRMNNWQTSLPQLNDDGITECVISLENQILASNPILEAFGNAQTIRNPNSSRYGKFIQLLFDQTCGPQGNRSPAKPSPRVVGASISVFLLERSRVVHVAPGERNFHIFGQLRSAAADARCDVEQLDHPPYGAEVQKLLMQLVETEEVRILGEAGAVGGLSMEDLAGFEQTVRAMLGMGMGGNEVARVLGTAAAVMSLGNVGLAGAETRNAQDVARLDDVPSSARALNHAAALLGLAPEALLAGLCRRVVRGGGRDSVAVELTRRQAEDSRDALCKAVFERLFAWIVRRINRTLQAVPMHGRGACSAVGLVGWAGARRIGVLDIFG